MWAAENAISLFRFGFDKLKKPSRVHGVVGYDDTTIYRITYFVTSILASLIPVASIAILHRVKSMVFKLVVIALFNVLVSISLMVLARAERTQVFAINAA